MSRSRQQAPAGGGTTVRPLEAAAAVLLVACALVPVLATGAGWAFPRGHAVEAAARALVLAAGIGAALFGLERAAGRLAPTLALLAGLTVLLRFAVPPAYSGDWDFLVAVTELHHPFGRWYGASLAYIGFHRALGEPLGWPATESIRWLSSICGALVAWLYCLLAVRLGLARAFRPWPFLYVAAFGAVGIGLGHLETYAVVALAFAAVLWAAVRALQAPPPAPVIVLHLVTGLALTVYIGLVLALPAWLVATAIAAGRALRARDVRAATAALAGLAIVPVLFLGVTRLGPAPAHPIEDALTEQIGAFADRQPKTAWFLPDDVHWPLLTNLTHPRYWFAGWHLADAAQQAWLGDRAGLLGLALLLTPAIASWSRRRGPAPEILPPLAAAGAIMAYAFTIVHGIAFPWDWDLASYGAVATSLSAGGLLAWWLGERRIALRSRAGVLVALVALAAQFDGVRMFLAMAPAPPGFGPAVAGVSVGASPGAIELREGRRPRTWFWMRNDTGQVLHVRSAHLFTGLAATSDDVALRQVLHRRRLLGTREIEPGGTALLAAFDPRLTGIHVSRDGTTWTKAEGLGPPGRYEARWIVRVDLAGDRRLTEFSSQPIALTILPPR
ncbi:MAG: hypothetical protein KBD01_15450 [Acidobacteria bacterium]|nr:hypothetical protein [Acidobacteriota bacterium]